MITSATVVYSKKVQEQQYEPADASVSFTLEVPEGTDGGAAASAALSLAKALVLEALGLDLGTLSTAAPVEAAQAPAVEAPAKTRGRRRKEEPPAAPAEATPASEPVATPAPVVRAAEPQGAPAQGEMTHEELQTAVHALVREGKTTVDKVREARDRLGYQKLADIPGRKRQSFLSSLLDEDL